MELYIELVVGLVYDSFETDLTREYFDKFFFNFGLILIEVFVE